MTPSAHGERPERAAAGTLRLFVAVELPAMVRDALASLANDLRTAIETDALRWVRPESIHITLKFLGAVEEARVQALHTALRVGVRDASPFDVQPTGLGSFGGARNMRVVWAGIGGDTGALAALAARIDVALSPLGFAREERPYSAHLTLARVRDDTTPDERQRLHKMVAEYAAPATPSLRVERVSLMRSTIGRGGAVYDGIGTYPLEGAR